MYIQIKTRFSDRVLFEGGFESLKHAVVKAVADRANLRGANLRGADLRGAKLMEANLREANLRGADLTEANLRGANLRGADLRGAKLMEANLWGADLTEADLTEANLRGEKLIINPVQIIGLRWFVLITAEYMSIGCERHTHAEWESFDRVRISQMDSHAWDWWKAHKAMLLAACELHRKEAEKVKEGK